MFSLDGTADPDAVGGVDGSVGDLHAGGLNARAGTVPACASPVVCSADELLERNLAALATRSPRAADAVRAATTCPLVAFDQAPDGTVIGMRRQSASDARVVSLCSKRRPLAEAERIADSAEVAEHALVCVLGFGLGHHVGEIARRMGVSGLVIVFEPDTGLLRAVLERVDCSAWLTDANVAVLTDADDPVAISRVLDGREALVGLGVRVIDHAPSMARLGDRAEAFRGRLRRAISDIRTTLVTTIAMSDTTARNLLMNAGRYALEPGLSELVGAATGRPAIVVSAGPSLEKNIEVLARPGVRDRFVIIAVQTVLKTLLARGIRPHFVTALDYHEISTRFYEGLTAADVEGVRLLVEPKANPAILDAYPGEVVHVGNAALREFLPDAPTGDGHPLLPDHGELPAGSTVAHLAYYAARYLGCDPVVLVGQDLGFTDGQYYSAGAAIHGVWAGELNTFNSLEMMEWTRIARSKGMLHPRTDQNGRTIYLDEQMATYLGQFERLFEHDRARGFRIIDATEGGTAKHGTELMTLDSVVNRYGDEPINLPVTRRSDPVGTATRTAALADALRDAQHQAARVVRLCGSTASLLRKLERDWDRVSARNRLIDRIHTNRAEVESLGAAWRLTRFIDQSGTLHRLRADRAIEQSPASTPSEVQRRRVGRDLRNVEGLARAAERAELLYGHARQAVLGRAQKLTRDPTLATAADEHHRTGGARTTASSSSSASHAASCGRGVAGVVLADFSAGGLGSARDLAAPLAAGRGPLWWTLARLIKSKQLSEIVVLTDEPARVNEVIEALPDGGPLRRAISTCEIHRTPGESSRRQTVAAARIWSRSCWRGGLGGMTVYDEAFEPGPTARWLAAHPEVGAIVVAGGDWAGIDPQLVDAVVVRHRESPEQHRVCFTQAAPGLAGLLMSRDLAIDLAGPAERGDRAPFSSLGGALGYAPQAARPDPIAQPFCVGVPAPVRDASARFIADTGDGLARLAAALSADSAIDTAAHPSAAPFTVPLALGASEIVASQRGMPQSDGSGVMMVTLVVNGGAGLTSRAAGWARSRLGMDQRSDEHARGMMTESQARGALAGLIKAGTAVGVTLDGVGDPLENPELPAIARVARELGAAAVHLRTPLSVDVAGQVFEPGCVDVVSIDVLAGRGDTYSELTGADDASYDAVLERVAHLVEQQDTSGGLGRPWIAPRITRCDAVLDQIEGLFDGSLLACGVCVIDPLPQREAGERLRALPVPASAIAANRGVVVHPDGRVLHASFERVVASVSGSVCEVDAGDKLGVTASSSPAVRAETTAEHEAAA